MVNIDKHFRGFPVFHGPAYLVLDELGRRVVCRLIDQQVLKISAEAQATLLPGFLVDLAALLVRDIESLTLGAAERMAVGRVPCGLSDFTLVPPHPSLAFRRNPLFP